MNFLAHAYLSFQHPKILVGNMISDFVKGAVKNIYPNDIRQGILLHRAIDSFTDTHPSTKKAKEIFRPHYRLYSGAIMDVLYDYFLANDAEVFTHKALQQFTQTVYGVLEEHATLLPATFIPVLFYMKTDDWLYNYQYNWGMEKSLKGLVRRAAYLSESNTAYKLFLDNHNFLRDCYAQFFPDVKQFAKEKLIELTR